MSTGVQFDRAKLIAVVTAARDSLQAELDDYTKRVEAYKVEVHNEWWINKREGLRRIRNLLSAGLKSSKPITAESLRVDGKGLGDFTYSEPPDFVVNRQVKAPQSGNPKALRGRIANLTGLIDLLNTQAGDVVSANQLRVMGYTKIYDIFRDAALTRAG